MRSLLPPSATPVKSSRLMKIRGPPRWREGRAPPPGGGRQRERHPWNTCNALAYPAKSFTVHEVCRPRLRHYAPLASVDRSRRHHRFDFHGNCPGREAKPTAELAWLPAYPKRPEQIGAAVDHGGMVGEICGVLHHPEHFHDALDLERSPTASCITAIKFRPTSLACG